MHYTPKLKKRTALLRKLKEVFRRYQSQPIDRAIQLINPVLRGWVNYFAVGHSSECFNFVQDWVEKNVAMAAGLRSTAKAVERPPELTVRVPVLDDPTFGARASVRQLPLQIATRNLVLEIGIAVRHSVESHNSVPVKVAHASH